MLGDILGLKADAYIYHQCIPKIVVSIQYTITMETMSYQEFRPIYNTMVSMVTV